MEDPGSLRHLQARLVKQCLAVTGKYLVCKLDELTCEGFRSHVEATNITKRSEWMQLQAGENMQEGLVAFRQKRKPVWGPAKL